MANVSLTAPNVRYNASSRTVVNSKEQSDDRNGKCSDLVPLDAVDKGSSDRQLREAFAEQDPELAKPQ